MTLGALSRAPCRYAGPLQGDGADGGDDENVGERDARQGPAQRALQSVPVLVCRHTRILPDLNLPGKSWRGEISGPTLEGLAVTYSRRVELAPAQISMPLRMPLGAITSRTVIALRPALYCGKIRSRPHLS